MYEKILRRIRETRGITEGEDSNLYKDIVRVLRQGRITKSQALLLAKEIYNGRVGKIQRDIAVENN